MFSEGVGSVEVMFSKPQASSPSQTESPLLGRTKRHMLTSSM